MGPASTATLFFAAIILSVVVHEAGHMFAARAGGMRVSRFFVGFGPTLWSRRYGETEVGVKAFPLGGFVRILGMSDSDVPLRSAVEEAQVDGQVTEERLREVLRLRGVRAADATLIASSAAPGSSDVAADVAAKVREVYGEGPYRVGSVPWRVLEGDEGRFYHERPFSAKALAIASGPLSHAFIALALLFGLQYMWEQPTGVSTTVVDMVLNDSPARDAGLLPGDLLVEVDGVRSSTFAPMRERLRTSPEVPLDVVVAREGVDITLQVTPVEVFDSEGVRIGAIGVLMRPETARVPASAALRAAWSAPQDQYFPGGLLPLVRTSISGIASLLSPQGLRSLGAQAAGVEERDPEGVVSLVGVTSIAGQVSTLDDSWRVLVALLAAVNVFLMLFNLLPLPPFDGGHLAVAALESAVTKVRSARGDIRAFRLPERAINLATVPVYVVLAFLLLASLWLDISAPLRLV